MNTENEIEYQEIIDVFNKKLPNELLKINDFDLSNNAVLKKCFFNVFDSYQKDEFMSTNKIWTSAKVS